MILCGSDVGNPGTQESLGVKMGGVTLTPAPEEKVSVCVCVCMRPCVCIWVHMCTFLDYHTTPIRRKRVGRRLLFTQKEPYTIKVFFMYRDL